MKRILAGLARVIPATWLGAGLAVSFVAIPVVFSPAVKAMLPPESVGKVAQEILGHYFLVQLGLWVVGVAVRTAAGWPWRRYEALAWTLLGVGSVVAALWLHPKLRELHRIKYDPAQSGSVHEAAAAEFRTWHGISQGGNLLLLLTLGGLVAAGLGRPATDSGPGNSGG